MSAVPHLAAHVVADGPAMYFGATIMTFALPLGAFIVIAFVLFFLFRSAHYGPKLSYFTAGPFTSVMTREPGPVPAPPAVAEAPAADAPAGTETVVDEPGPDTE